MSDLEGGVIETGRIDLDDPQVCLVEVEKEQSGEAEVCQLRP